MSLASRKLIQATAGAAGAADTGDDDFANVVLLLDGDGTSDDNNETFTDSSTNGFTVTESGGVVQGSFSPYGDNWSNYFNDDGYLQVTKSTDLDLDTNNWTIECWLNLKSASDPEVVLSFGYETETTRGYIVYLNSDSTLHFAYSTNGSNNTDTSMGSHGIVANEWTHLAVVRNGSTITGYINGSALGTTINIGSSDIYYPTSGNVRIGSDGTNALAGYISNIRLVNGTAVYTSNFTPSTSPLTAITNTKLLTCQSNRFVDNSTSAHTITITGTHKVTPFSPFKNDDARDITTDGGSGYFGGSGDYLSIADDASFTIGSSDFTAECWVYPTASPNKPLIFGQWSDPYSWVIQLSNDGNRYARMIFHDGNFQDTVTSTPLALNAWSHLAIVKSGSTATLYVNGVSVGTDTVGTLTDSSSALTIGAFANGDFPFQGSIADARLVVGTAVYTSDFTPPTSPLTAVTNTELLVNFQDAGIFDRSGINNLDTVGDARLGFAPIYGTGSLAFDGTGDYLETPFDDVYAFDTGDFTVEGWVSIKTIPTGIYWRPLVSFGGAGSNNQSSWIFGLYGNNGSPQLVFYRYDGTTETYHYRSWTPNTNQWYHIAASRSGTDLRLFVDGVQLGATFTDSVNYASQTTQGLVVGFLRTGAGAATYSYFDGYIDDLRVTKGVARYTSDFTPPDEIDLSTDTHREYVTFFLDGDGTVNGQNNTFTDSSTNDFTVTESGSVVQGVFSPYGDNWSNHFGSGDYLNTATTSVFNVGTSTDFTAEVFFLSDGSYTPALYDCFMGQWTSGGPSGSWILGLDASGFPMFMAADYDTAARLMTGTTDVTDGNWHHIAVTRNGSVYRLFVDGTQEATVTNSGYNVGRDSTALYINAYELGTSANPEGWSSNHRFVSGTALYTSSFTPSTTPLTAVTGTQLLTTSSNRFQDKSSNNLSITATQTPEVSRFSPFESDKPYDITTDGGSAYLASSSEYLSVADNSAFDFGSGDFTIECWAKTSSFSSAYNVLIAQWNTSSYAWVFRITSSLVGLYAYNGATQDYTASVTNGLNQWDHFAVSREGSSLRFFKNGALIGTSAISVTIANATANITVGILSDLNSVTAHNGYISDLRVVKGTAVYTSAFTPPTAPLTAVTNTELLLNFQDSAIPDLSGLNNIDTVGNAKVGGTDPTKYGSNSLKLDGSGDYLLFPSSESFGYSTGDFTLECWVYKDANPSADAGIIEQRPASTNGNYPMLGLNSSGQLFYYVNAAYKISASASTALSNQAWDHVAYVRSGGNLGTLYINGTSVGTWVDTTDYVSETPLRVGEHAFSAAQFNGFIDDLRITKGVARYTSNFTPPTDALPKF